MSRKKKNETQSDLKTFTIEEVLDQVDEANLSSIIVVGRDANGNTALFGSYPTASFFHHYLNAAIFQLNVMENNSIAAANSPAEQIAEALAVE